MDTVAKPDNSFTEHVKGQNWSFYDFLVKSAHKVSKINGKLFSCEMKKACIAKHFICRFPLKKNADTANSRQKNTYHNQLKRENAPFTAQLTYGYTFA